MRLGLIVIIGILCPALLAGCTLPAPAPASSGAKGAVTLVTYSDFALPKSVLSDFTNATGYPVSVVADGDAGAMLNKAILSVDHPLGDVMFGVDNALIYRAKEHKVFQPYAPPNASQIPEKFRAPFMDNGSMLETPFDFGYVELNADPSWFARHNLSQPTDLRQICTDVYAPLTVVENPYTSSPGFAFLLATVDRFGESGDFTYKDFWRDFAHNGGKITSDWGSAYGSAFTQGYDTSGSLDRPLVVSYSTSPAYNPMMGYGNATSLNVDAQKGAWFQVEGVGILSGAKNVEGAKALIDWLITPDVQAKGAFAQVTYPVHPDATIPAEYKLYAPEPSKPASLAPADIDAHRDAWLQGWRDATGQA